MSKFHVGPNGPGPCGAGDGRCPYGGESGLEDHYDKIEEAQGVFEVRMREKYGTLATTEAEEIPPPPPPEDKSTPLPPPPSLEDTIPPPPLEDTEELGTSLPPLSEGTGQSLPKIDVTDIPMVTGEGVTVSNVEMPSLDRKDIPVIRDFDPDPLHMTGFDPSSIPPPPTPATVAWDASSIPWPERRPLPPTPSMSDVMRSVSPYSSIEEAVAMNPGLAEDFIKEELNYRIRKNYGSGGGAERVASTTGPAWRPTRSAPRGRPRTPHSIPNTPTQRQSSRVHENVYAEQDSTGRPTYDDGRRKAWEKNGGLHREGDLPAEITEERKTWAINGKKHRIGAPAVIENNGFQEYWINGVKHNEDGPAVTYADGSKEYWLNGKKVTRAGFAVRNFFRRIFEG